jgi:hypothetical protein
MEEGGRRNNERFHLISRSLAMRNMQKYATVTGP